MQYIGGKVRIGKIIAKYINETYSPDIYIEPLLGMCGVMRHIKANQKYGYDSHRELVSMLKDVQLGREFPDNISEEFYMSVKRNEVEVDDSLRCFMGHGCAFGGCYFRGYARSGKRNFALQAKNSLIKLSGEIQDVYIECSDYRDTIIPDSSIVYCDPPYNNTWPAGTGKDKFNSDEFFDWCREKAKKATVLVSEIECPNDFQLVLEIPKSRDLRSNNSKILNERLFLVNIR